MTIFTDGPVLRDAILVHRVLSTDRKNYVIKKQKSNRSQKDTNIYYLRDFSKNAFRLHSGVYNRLDVLKTSGVYNRLDVLKTKVTASGFNNRNFLIKTGFDRKYGRIVLVDYGTETKYGKTEDAIIPMLNLFGDL